MNAFRNEAGARKEKMIMISVNISAILTEKMY